MPAARVTAGERTGGGVVGRSGDAGLVLCAGIPRSGSTWLYNAARLQLEHGGRLQAGWIDSVGREPSEDSPTLIKLHEFDVGLAKRAAVVLTSRRDPVEIATSAHRLGWVTGRDETLAFIRHVATLHEMWAAFSTFEVEYAAMRADPRGMLASLAAALGLGDDAERDRAVLDRIDSAHYTGPDGTYDQKTLLHPQHIGDGSHRLDEQVRGEIESIYPAGFLAARAIQEIASRGQVIARAEARSQSERQLAEANADRAALRQTIKEAASRLLGTEPEGDACRALGEASNGAVLKQAESNYEIARLRDIEARAHAAEAENRALQERMESLSAELASSSAQLAQERAVAVELGGALRAAHAQIEDARRVFSELQTFASVVGGAMSRLLRLPGGVRFVRAISHDRAPWLATFDRDLIRSRKSSPPVIPTGERSDGSAEVTPGRPQLSVIICTHNPRPDLLAWTLDSIRAQTLDRGRFELIVVDNNSDPALDAGELDPDGSLGLRVVRESRPGLTFARIGGLEASNADLIVYVDDDNALKADYLEQAVRIAGQEPRVGSFGGIAEAVLEAEPAGWVRELIPHLGVRDHGSEVITSEAAHWGEWDPIGAGMVVRRVVAERYAKVVESTATAGGLGRQGKLQLSGEDTLMNRCANLEGFACSYQPSLRLRHFMKADRLTGRNIRRTIEGHGRSFVVLERTLGREVAPIEGLTRWRWLAQRALVRATNGPAKGYALWRWDVGYARASAAVSGPQRGISAGVADSSGEER